MSDHCNHYNHTVKLSKKRDTFPSPCKTAKIKLQFKKGIKTEAKNYKPNINGDKKNRKRKFTFKNMICCTVTNQALKQIISQINVCLN